MDLDSIVESCFEREQASIPIYCDAEVMKLGERGWLQLPTTKHSLRITLVDEVYVEKIHTSTYDGLKVLEHHPFYMVGHIIYVDTVKHYKVRL